MLIHVTPQFYSGYRDYSPILTRLEIPELGIILEGQDLATRKPWPNKCFFSGCRRIGQKAVSGFLFDVSVRPPYFTVHAHWQTVGLPGTVLHEVRHEIVDADFDFVSDDMILWGAFEGGSARAIGLIGNFSPMQAKPCMSHFVTDHGPTRADSHGSVSDEVSPNSRHIIHRREVFRQPTLDRDRLLDTRYHMALLPTLDQALPGLAAHA